MKISVPLGLFITGAACFSMLFLFPHVGRRLVVLGGVMWASAYFWVLADNFRRRAPLWTRGGMLKYEEKPRTYRFVYSLMLFLGVFFLLVLIALNIFQR
jgi:hypothetical protein